MTGDNDTKNIFVDQAVFPNMSPLCRDPISNIRDNKVLKKMLTFYIAGWLK